MSMAIVRLSNRALTVVCLSFDLKPYSVRCLRYLYCIFDICGKCEANSYLLMHYCWVLFPLPWNNLFTNFNGKKVEPSRVLEAFLIEDDVCNPMRTAYFKTIWQLCLRGCQYYFHILYVLAHAIFAFINDFTLPRLAGCLGQVDRVSRVGGLPCLACKFRNKRMRSKPSLGSSVSRVAQLAGAPSLHVNGP